MKRHPWKGILVPLAIFSLAIASRSFAQQSSAASNGLYPEPDAKNTITSPSTPSADAYVAARSIPRATATNATWRRRRPRGSKRRRPPADSRTWTRTTDPIPWDRASARPSGTGLPSSAAVGSSCRWLPSDTCGGLVPGSPGPRRRSSWPLSPTLPPNPTAPKSKARSRSATPHDISPDSHLFARHL